MYVRRVSRFLLPGLPKKTDKSCRFVSYPYEELHSKVLAYIVSRIKLRCWLRPVS